MDSKTKYINFAQKYDLPLYFQPWWLDITAENWNVSIAEKKGNISGFWVYRTNKKYMFKVSSMPALTQRLGIFLLYPEGQKYERRLAYEKEVIFRLAQNMPEFDFFSQNLDYRITNLLPFHWLGFKTRVRYTYLIIEQDINKIYDSMRGNIRRNIKKAIKEGISVKIIDDPEILTDFAFESFRRKKQKFPYTKTLIANLDKATSQRKQRTIYAAYKNNKIIASIYIANDKKNCYYLMGGFDENEKSSGAVSLLMWQAIQDCKKEKKIFDFEGSMNQDIEKFFRGFGAIQQPYFNIYKCKTKLHCIFNCIKKMV